MKSGDEGSTKRKTSQPTSSFHSFAVRERKNDGDWRTNISPAPVERMEDLFLYHMAVVVVIVVLFTVVVIVIFIVDVTVVAVVIKVDIADRWVQDVGRVLVFEKVAP